MTFTPDTSLVDEVHPSPNVEPRRLGPPSILLLHYTGLVEVARAVKWLAAPESKVSCHYVIDTDGRIIQMVPEGLRAWHAGVSSWAGETDINSASIGIEIHNPGHEQGYPDFPTLQMHAVRDLCLDILARNEIVAANVLAHSDVAPARKIDPGEKFNWAWLAAAGIGLWVAPDPCRDSDPGLAPGTRGPLVSDIRAMLAHYGYGIEPGDEHDALSVFVTKAFQRHFRPERVDGLIDASTVATLTRLLAARQLATT